MSYMTAMSNITDGDIRDAINKASELHKDNLFTGEIAWDRCVIDMGTELLWRRKEVETLRNALDNDIRDKKQIAEYAAKLIKALKLIANGKVTTSNQMMLVAEVALDYDKAYDYIDPDPYLELLKRINLDVLRRAGDVELAQEIVKAVRKSEGK